MTEHTINPDLFLSNYLYESLQMNENLAYFRQNLYRDYRLSLIKMALPTVLFRSKEVLQVGMQHPDIPHHILAQKPREFYAVGLFPNLLNAINETPDIETQYDLFNGNGLHYPDGAFDIVVSAAFLENYADSKTMRKMLYQMAEIARDEIILIETTAPEYFKNPFYRGREVDYYQQIFERKGFKLVSKRIFSTKITDWMLQKMREKYNAPEFRVKNAPLSKNAEREANKWLLFTKKLDALFAGDEGLTRMIFKKEKEEIEYY